MSLSITIQELDETTSTWLVEEAKRRSVSVEAVARELIHQGIASAQKSSPLQTYHDLDSLAGTWTDEEAEEFLKAIADFEQVDEALWQ